MGFLQICHGKTTSPQYIKSICEHAEDSVKEIVFSKGNLIPEPDPNQPIVIVSANSEAKSISQALYEHGFKEVKLYLTELLDRGIEEPITIDTQLPRLERLEIEIFKRCNLNCKGCSHFSNLISGSGEVDINKFESDLKQVSKYFWGIETLRLMGGEPLLADNYLDFVKIARRIFPDADISLVTNGLLLPRIPSDQFEELNGQRCRIVISNYPPTNEKLNEIRDVLDANHVSYNIGAPIKRFYKSLREQPFDCPDRSFEHCIFSKCHALKDGMLSMCGLDLYCDRLNDRFGTDLPATGSIDLYSTEMTGWEIEKKLNSKKDLCRYCHTAYIPIKWEQSSSKSSKKEDYFVGSSVYEQKVMPAAQKVLLPVIKKVYSKYVSKHNKMKSP